MRYNAVQIVLTVVDVYQDWAGPCVAMGDLLKKIKFELQDSADDLHYAAASASLIPQLSIFRGTCKPTWLFFASGELVAWMHGANAPLMRKMIIKHINREREVLAGKRKRKLKLLEEAVPADHINLDDDVEELDQLNEDMESEDDDDVELKIPENSRIILTHEDFIEKTELMRYYIPDAGFKILDNKVCRALKEADIKILSDIPIDILIAFKDVKLGLLLAQISDPDNEDIMAKFKLIFSSDETVKGSLKQKLDFKEDHVGFHSLSDSESGHFIAKYYVKEMKNDKYEVDKMKSKKSGWAVTKKIKNVISMKKALNIDS